MKTAVTNTQVPQLPKTISLNKLLVHRDTRMGSRLYHKGGYYVVMDSAGEGLMQHWVCELDERQGP